jgi:hypothetical protein
MSTMIGSFRAERRTATVAKVTRSPHALANAVGMRRYHGHVPEGPASAPVLRENGRRQAECRAP